MYTRRAINSRIKQRVALLVVLLFSVFFSAAVFCIFFGNGRCSEGSCA